jgi:hypothetical protein
MEMRKLFNKKLRAVKEEPIKPHNSIEIENYVR